MRDGPFPQRTGQQLDSERVGQLLDRWQNGDRDALEELTPLVYRELHRLATGYMRHERSGHTLQATALVNEAFMRLGAGTPSFADSSHFYGVAAKLMRHILVDHAKARTAIRRGGGIVRDAKINVEQVPTMGGIDLEEIDEAITKLAQENAEAANAMELHYFAGMTSEETADILGVSVSTITRDLRFAKAWLLKQLKAEK
jgi:RNA polymerase sigma factor (TIGR02999 family)